MAQIEAGADALTLPDHATGDLVSARVLPPLPAGPAHRVRRGARRADHPAHLRAHRRPHGATSPRPAWRRSTTTPRTSPEESMEAVDGRISLVGNINNPETLYSRRAPTRSSEEVRENLEAGVQMVGPECAIPLQTPIENLRAIRDAVANGTRPPTARDVSRWPSSATSPTTSSARRSTSSSSAPTSAQRLIEQFAAHAATTAAHRRRAGRRGRRHGRRAHAPGARRRAHGARGHGRRPDRGHGHRRHQVPRELHLRARGARLRARHEGRDGAHRADPLGLGHRAASARS